MARSRDSSVRLHLKLITFLTLGMVALILVLARTYHWIAIAKCPSMDTCAKTDPSTALCLDCKAQPPPPSATNQIFFAVQTVTTTGYGSAVILSSPLMQQLAIVGMLLGTAIWFFLTAFTFSLISKYL